MLVVEPRGRGPPCMHRLVLVWTGQCMRLKCLLPAHAGQDADVPVPAPARGASSSGASHGSAH